VDRVAGEREEHEAILILVGEARMRDSEASACVPARAGDSEREEGDDPQWAGPVPVPAGLSAQYLLALLYFFSSFSFILFLFRNN
jgi:hypothetical protein